MKSTTTSARINGFDALRTIAMWLGVVLHAIIAYKTIPESGWPDDPTMNLGFLDWLYETIHSFRMPLFFLVAGFFARMVIMKSGMPYFIEQRRKRILIPFVLGILVLVPLTMAPFHYHRFHFAQGLSESAAMQKTVQWLVKWDGIAHLWFLYYLLIFYFVCWLAHFLPERWKAGWQQRFEPVMRSLTIPKLAVITVLLFLLTWWQQAAVPPVYTGLKPQIYHFLYYGFFFLLGWIMQVNMNSVLSLSKPGVAVFLTGIALSVVLHFGLAEGFLYYLLYAAQTICLTFGITGIFIRYASANSPTWRYYSDASYWVYLFHMGIVAALQVLFLDAPLQPWLKLPLVLLLTFIVCMLSYHFLVRFSIIGNYLHGKRSKENSFISIFFHKKIARAKKTV